MINKQSSLFALHIIAVQGSRIRHNLEEDRINQISEDPPLLRSSRNLTFEEISRPWYQTELFIFLMIGVLGTAAILFVSWLLTGQACGLCLTLLPRRKKQQTQLLEKSDSILSAKSSTTLYSSASNYVPPSQRPACLFQQHRTRFEAHVSRAKDDVEEVSRTNHDPEKSATEDEEATVPKSYPPPYSGFYRTLYADRITGQKHSASLELIFTPQPKLKKRGNNTSGDKQRENDGFRIAGRGSDIDGTTVVEEGFVAANGWAWWRERNLQSGLLILSQGRFLFDGSRSRFEGRWLGSSMESGAYKSFQASKR